MIAAVLLLLATLADPPPRASLITLSAPDASADVSITGADGAAPARSTVIAINLDTGHYATAPASGSGAFQIPRLYAPRGTFVLIKVDPSGQPFDDRGQALIGMAGTILHVAHPPEVFAGASQVAPSAAVWRFEGSVTQQNDGAFVVKGNVVLDTPAVDGGAAIRVTPQLALERFTMADGSPVLAQSTFTSTFVTPTGFPIERTPFLHFGWFAPAAPTLQRTGPGRAEAEIEVHYRPQAALGDGFYRPVLYLQSEGVPHDATSGRPMLFDVKAVDRASRKTAKVSVYGPLLKIGDPAPPKSRWMLLADHLSEGTRGTTALEDRASFAFAPRVAAQSDTLIVPRGTYRLEPYAPLVSLGDRELPSPPSIPFRFPSGSLTAQVTHPDGRVTTIAAKPFVQSRSINAVLSSGLALEAGGGYPHDPYQLSTMDPSFDVAFDAYGKYTIRLDGAIDDLWGNRWSGGGTYEVLVAKPLVLDTAVLPGTPFEAGDLHAAEVQIVPPVPAEVEIRVGDVVRRGVANRFGRLRVEGIPLPQPGEYRTDVVARWRDANGELWAGARTWGSVIAPRDAALIAHGSRGVDDQPHPRPAWFRLSAPTGSGHIQVPFFNGDVLWAVDLDAAIPHVTFDDPGRRFARIYESRDGGLRKRYLDGSTPPQILTSGPLDAHAAPESIEVWSYAYRSVQRPLVRVREIVGEESGIAGYYWRFNSAYGGQTGVGEQGDLPNDFKFQFGGIVLRGPAIGAPQYAIYGSLFVLVPDDDPDGGSRVMPPFQGNPGGQNGGPLFRLHGQPVDLFFHPTALRPGSILHRGELVSIAGYSAPTLPSKIEVVFTSPSGATRTIAGQANLIGWFHDPALDFVAGEEGVWTAKVRILFDGVTSAGQVTQPFPSGESEFHFYVVSAAAPPVTVDADGTGPITFRITPPAGLRDATLTYTTAMPGFVLEEGTSTSMRYTYDPAKLAGTFPNLDPPDVITISFLLSGTDEAGVRRHFARQVVFDGRELHMPAQEAHPKRRAARK